ncbi:MAG TPA: hypothetical protein VHW67_06420 [Solirubrobacteraceae bacterium]|jgi:streptogramin lyase|nr:hypothetical protein [Solirubrobacteraceae bacterium]
MRSALRSLSVSVIGLALTGVLFLAPTSAIGANAARRPSESVLGGSLVAPSVDQLLLGEGARDARQAAHNDPLAVAERSASRSRFEGLSTAAAASKVRSAFPALIEQTEGGVPVLGHGRKVVRYLTDHAAQVALPGGGKGVLEAFAPISQRNGHRHLPLDLRLTQRGDGFGPVRSDVDVDVPRSVAEGVSLAGLGVSMTPVDGRGRPLASPDGSLDGAAVVWRHPDRAGAEDLTSVAKASPEGFDLTTLLLSGRSPKNLYFHIGTPAGTRLAETRSGSVQIVQGGRPLATIAPVSAEDAEGTNVPVSLRVHGDTLELSLALGGSFMYPIAVDPEVNDSQLATTTAGKRSNWEFFTSNAGAFGKAAVYEGPGAERLETKGIGSYGAAEYAYWGYQTKGVSHIYEIKTETSAHNKGAKIESFLEFLNSGGRETKKMLSNEFENPEYEKKAATACAANGGGVEECLPGSGKEKNAVHFQQSSTATTSSWGFSDVMSQGIVSIAEPTGTHSATSYNTTSPTLEFETEVEGKKEKIARQNVLYGTGGWLSRFNGAVGLNASDPGIGVSATKLEYESSAGKWTQLFEHNYLGVENACQGVQCYAAHSEYATLPAGLPDGEPKVRYRAEEAISGTQSLESEGKTTIKVDSTAPHDLEIEGIPFGNELSERPYELTGEATDGEGSTVPSSGIKSLALFVDGHEFGTAGGSCTVAKGACTASRKWTVNGAELGAGKHDIELVVLDNAGNEARHYEPITIRHSTPVALGPGSVDLESGDFALSATDVSLGSGLTVGRNFSSRATSSGESGPLGPEWNISLSSTESLQELIDGSMLMTAGDGKQTIFASLGSGKFESPTGDSNLELSLEENKTTKQKLAYYLKNPAAHTSVKFTQPTGSPLWVPTKQEGTTANDTLTYTYKTSEQYTEYPVHKTNADAPDIEGITPGRDGNVWFVEHLGDAVGKINRTGTTTIYPLSGWKEPNRITEGPDGNMWFTESANPNKIGKITPEGVITEYPLPNPYKSPIGITAGPDGRLWFTLLESSKIGAITTSGVVTEYSLPEKSGPLEITSGPDGNLWFTNVTSQKVGKITTSGVVTEYTTPEKREPRGIVTGPDKNLWFTEGGPKGKLAKITTAGVITDYPLTVGVRPTSITAGPDGKLWFTDGEGDRLGNITTSGVITEFKLAASSSTKQITAGPDGKLWYANDAYAEEAENTIGTMPTSGVITEPTEELAPSPAGVSCTWTTAPTEMQPGCRALEFKYSAASTAKGEASGEWGEFKGRLMKTTAVAYNPSTKKMQETVVSEYAYDSIGRLRAQWDPRISPSLKTTYGYDEEGRVTALSPPGQQPWAFTYGTSAGDMGSGRLLKMGRPPASTELWSGSPSANTAVPKITGSPVSGARLAVSNGTWTNSPLAYGYQWEDCNSSGGGCTPILGADNANYTVTASDVGHTLAAIVTATNGGGSARVKSGVTSEAINGAISEYALPTGSHPFGITAGPDGNVWFTDTATGKAGKITSAGTVTEYAAEKDEPEGITTGPDGNLWFVEHSIRHVNHMTTAGALTVYTLTHTSTYNVGIAAGFDGNMWFTEASAGYIGKISTSDEVLGEYALPAGSEPENIVSGPDKNLWFTEYATSKIGKITTAGVITEYSLPAGSHPYGITSGPDGNLWFTDYGTNKIGKITTTGAITEYSLPSGSSPRGIAAGPEGNLWIAEYGTSKIARVTTSGSVTEFALPAGSQPYSITAGADKNIWFTEYGTNRIGKIGSTSSEGELIAPSAGTTLDYNVPITGSGAPRDMSKAEVAKWGQVDNPVEATAIFPMDEPQGWPASSYKRANVYYLDEQGRQVNLMHPSSSSSGSVSTTEYNEFNDVIRTLSADSRAIALAAGASSAEKSKLLDTQSTFNGEGKKEGEVAEPGTRLIDTLGPQRMVKYKAGNEVKESLARDHTEYVYDQGAPSGETYDLLTEKFDLAQLQNHEEVEVRTTKTSYSGQSNLGWKLRAPTSVTVDPEGLKLTTTTEYNPTTAQITEVRGTGAENTLAYATKFGEAGTEAGKLKAPWGTVVNSEGKLWVVDSANNRVEQFSSAGAYLTKFGETGSEPGKLKEPQGIALDSAGHIWVADTGNNRIEEFSATGTYMATVGSLGTESGKFKAPSDLAFDTKGNLWVADTGNSRVEKFDKEAKYSSEFSSLGSEPGKLKEPKGIAVDSGEHIWVADTGNNRVQEFSSTGSLLKRLGVPGAGEGQLNAPIDLRIDSSGNIWTVDSANNRAEAFSPSGAYVTQIGFKGSEAGQLTGPRGIAFDATGKAWVSDSANNRLEQWSKGANAHDQKSIYYSSAANTEGFPVCGSHPEWAGLICETLPAKQPELMGLPKLPVTSYSYNMWNEAETVTETFGATTRTKKETYDEAGRRTSSETTASTGVSLPKVSFAYNKESGKLETLTTVGEGKVLASEYDRLGQLVKFTDADGNVAKYKYLGAENDFLLGEVSDSSDGGTSRQTYEYDPTTKLRTKLIDSAAGSFSASYDVEGKLTSLVYPFNMCANYSYNSVGEATNVQYLKTSNCSESEPGIWYSDESMASVRGEVLNRHSTLANESYAYDAASRLVEAQETPTGEGCTVRSYSYDEEADRASSSVRAPGVGGACQTEGGTTEAHNYDEADRLADGGMAYDGLGNVTKLPAADAEGHELTSSFYVDNAVASQAQNGVTNEYKLDPEGRVRETITGATKIVSHYDSAGGSVAWTESAEKSVRNIGGIDGSLVATQTNGETPVLQLHDLQGNVVATIGDKAGETKLLSSYNSTEFGVPNGGKTPPKFAYLGALEVESSLSSGVITYGATSYVPQTGRALQSEAVEPPGLQEGSGAGAVYTMQEEPWNMQGAARAGAEAPGLEAAREQAALEAAMRAASVESHDPVRYLTRGEAEKAGEKLKNVATWAEVWDATFSVVGFLLVGPAEFIESEVAALVVGSASVIDWTNKVGKKLLQCAKNHQGFPYCRFTWWEDHVSLPIVGSVLEFPDYSKLPTVERCNMRPTVGGRFNITPFCLPG